MVAILVGDDQTRFAVQARVLSAHSTVLKNAVGEHETTSEVKPIIICNVTEETFNTFVAWIYSNGVPTDSLVVAEMNNEGRKESSVASNEADKTGQMNGYEIAPAASTVTPTRAIESNDKPWDADLSNAGRVFERLVDAFVFGYCFGLPPSGYVAAATLHPRL